MKTCKATQGRRLIAYLKRSSYTYGEMQRLGISTSPQKRIVESLLPGEIIIKSSVDGLIRWRVRMTGRPL